MKTFYETRVLAACLLTELSYTLCGGVIALLPKQHPSRTYLRGAVDGSRETLTGSMRGCRNSASHRAVAYVLIALSVLLVVIASDWLDPFQL